MTTNPRVELDRENARRRDGRFGEQERDEGDFDVDDLQPAPVRAWLPDGVTPHPTGGYVTVHRDRDGGIKHLDSDGNLHREDGPAYIRTTDVVRTEAHYVHGVEHREDGPAFQQWSRWPRTGDVDELNGFKVAGTFVSSERVRYTDSLDPGVHDVDGQEVLVKPSKDGAAIDWSPAALPGEDPAEVRRRRWSAARLRDAVDLASKHPRLVTAQVDAYRDSPRRGYEFGDPDDLYVSAAVAQREADGVDFESEHLRSSAHDLMHEGFDRAEAAQQVLDRRWTPLSLLPSRRTARRVAAHELGEAQDLVLHAGLVLECLSVVDDGIGPVG